MSPEEWNEFCVHVTCNMINNVKPFVTPISKVVSDEHGELVGSGSYVQMGNSHFLITNEHVARHVRRESLCHQFQDADVVLRCTNQFVAVAAPIDVAATRISDNSWLHCAHNSRCIPIERFADSHNAVASELFFIIGFSGARSSFYFGALNSPATPYLARECAIPREHGDTRYHFAFDYNPEYAVQVPGPRSELPTPPGMSGSLVWNTRAVDAIQSGVEWNPSMACVTGIVWGWPTSDRSLIATRVEHINIRKMCETAACA